MGWEVSHLYWHRGEWQEPQNQPNFQCEEILALIHLNKDRWLLRYAEGIIDHEYCAGI